MSLSKSLVDRYLVSEELSSVLDSRFTKYAFMSLEDRALPDARDGLKPSQRRILVAMHDLKLHPNNSTEKSAKICGSCSGDYHPHGESIVYPTLCRLVQPWAMRYPLLIGQGNFGNVDGDAPAAMRYSEAKLSQYGEALLTDLSEDVVEYQPNYNEKLKEPVVLPGMLPNLLINGCEGIAVGWATKMLPHNLKEVVAAIKKYIDNPKISVEKLLKCMPGPDFPTGGKMLGQQGVLDYYKTGKGKIKLEGKYSIDKDAKGRSRIVVTELPYQSSPKELLTKIKSLVDDGIVTNISDLKNLSSKKTGLMVVIEIAKNQNPAIVLNQLLKKTCLRKIIAVNQTVLVGGKVLPDANLVQLIAAFVEHRKVVLTNKFKAENARNQARIHILEGLLGIVDKIDLIIKLIRNSDSPEKAEEALLKNKYVRSVEQAKAVLSITLRQLTKLEAGKLLAECNELKKRCQWLKTVLNDSEEILKVIVEEQEELAKKFGDARRTEIVQDVEEIPEEDLIKDENLMITLTGNGYIKALSSDSKISEEAFESLNANSKDLVLFFSNKGMVYQRRAYEIPQSSKAAKGIHVSNLLNLGADENITNILSLETLEQDGYVVIITKNGIIKKTEISEYTTTRRLSGITAITLGMGDEVVFAAITDGRKDIFIVTAQSQCVRYSEKIVPLQGRATRGSRALKLEYDDTVVQAFLLNAKEMPDILVVTSGGFAKRTNAEEYRSFNNKQIKGHTIIKRTLLSKTPNGEVIGACAINNDNSLLALTSNGKCIKVGPKDIRSGRTIVKILKLDNETLMKIAKI